MSNYSLTAESVTKSFGRRLIFENINFNFSEKGIIGISGPNGSGKSTLVKIIAGIITPNGGKVIHRADDIEIIPERLHEQIGFVSPYLVLYDEFTTLENLQMFAKIRAIDFDREKIDGLLSSFLLFDRKDDLVKAYSSGMKQRLKFIFALMHSPKLIILDEPTSNLDSAGKKVVYELIKSNGEESIVLVASNEESDLALCDNIIQLENYK